jgi:alpha-ketoglutarate-dependent taurine dioxygenase
MVMSITVVPLHHEFVAEISGIDLKQPLAAVDRDIIAHTIDRHAVVCSTGQTLTDEQQVPSPGTSGRSKHRRKGRAITASSISSN